MNRDLLQNDENAILKFFDDPYKAYLQIRSILAANTGWDYKKIHDKYFVLEGYVPTMISMHVYATPLRLLLPNDFPAATPLCVVICSQGRLRSKRFSIIFLISYKFKLNNFFKFFKCIIIICFKGIAIKQNHKNVDNKGNVSLEYLEKWNHNSSLIELMRELRSVFCKSPPMYSNKSNQFECIIKIEPLQLKSKKIELIIY